MLRHRLCVDDDREFLRGKIALIQVSHILDQIRGDPYVLEYPDEISDVFHPLLDKNDGMLLVHILGFILGDGWESHDEFEAMFPLLRQIL